MNSQTKNSKIVIENVSVEKIPQNAERTIVFLIYIQW